MEWHKIFDPNSQDLDRLAERYHLHPLHIEDCRHRNQSAKIEEDPGYIFTVMKGVRLDSEGALLTADLDIFLGIGFRHHGGGRRLPRDAQPAGPGYQSIRDQSARRPGRITASSITWWTLTCRAGPLQRRHRQARG